MGIFKKDSREKRILERYRQLAGLVLDGVMVNDDKKSRAEIWVIQQEKLESSKKINWHQTWWGKILIAVMAGVTTAVILNFIYK